MPFIIVDENLYNRSEKSVQAAITAQFQGPIIEKGTGAHTICRFCNTKTTQDLSTMLSQPPKLMQIRFLPATKGAFQVDESMDVCGLKYHYVAEMAWQGKRPPGHWVAYVRHPTTGNLLLYNDSKVRVVPKDCLRATSVAFYVQHDASRFPAVFRDAEEQKEHLNGPSKKRKSKNSSSQPERSSKRLRAQKTKG
jgi:hypothetical protein